MNPLFSLSVPRTHARVALGISVGNPEDLSRGCDIPRWGDVGHWLGPACESPVSPASTAAVRGQPMPFKTHSATRAQPPGVHALS